MTRLSDSAFNEENIMTEQNSNNPYEAPNSSFSVGVAVAPHDIPKKIQKNIKAGWIAALISAGMTLIFSLLGASNSLYELGDIWDLWSLFDVALLLVFAFGVYKKSRVASTALVIYFLLSKIFLIQTMGFSGLGVLGIVFMIIYIQAMIATYQYHKIRVASAGALQVNHIESQEYKL